MVSGEAHRCAQAADVEQLHAVVAGVDLRRELRRGAGRRGHAAIQQTAGSAAVPHSQGNADDRRRLVGGRQCRGERACLGRCHDSPRRPLDHEIAGERFGDRAGPCRGGGRTVESLPHPPMTSRENEQRTGGDGLHGGQGWTMRTPKLAGAVNSPASESCTQ